MSRIRWLLVPAVALVALVALGSDRKSRTWTTHDGKFTTKATLDRIESDRVVLNNGTKNINVKLDRLSRTDLIYVIGQMNAPPSEAAGNAPDLGYPERMRRLNEVQEGWTRRQVWTHCGLPESRDKWGDIYRFPNGEYFTIGYDGGMGSVVVLNRSDTATFESGLDSFLDPANFKPHRGAVENFNRQKRIRHVDDKDGVFPLMQGN